MSAPTDPPPFSPGSPFCDPGRKDLILRSLDGAAFYVHRLVLSLASPVFEDMLSLSQPDLKHGVPEVLMPHAAVMLEPVLRFFYLGAQPVVETLGQLREILEILVDRHNVESVIALGRMHLRAYIVSQPVGAFAVAAHQGWNDLVLEAAKECLKLPLRAWDRDPPEELRHIPATLYQRLIQYHY
ncbi:hypothetical protein B0H13DRAFT_1650320 [Mycena leptocephala]|nr:hypothetical protein B0H13DRAFT_1650320 [Mycena leptocephala]